MRIFNRVIFSFLLLVVATPALADTMWTLSGVTLYDGATASGYFDVNALGEITAVDVTTTAGTTATTFHDAGFPFPAETYGASVGGVHTFCCYEALGAVLETYNTVELTPTTYPSNPYQLDLTTAQALTIAALGVPLCTPDTFPPHGSYCGAGEPYNAAGLFSAEFSGTGNYDEVTGGVLNGTEITTSAVPEPASILLLGTGLAGYGVWRRRMRKRF